MSLIDLNKLIKDNNITLEILNKIYKEYGIAFIIRNGKIKGLTK